MIQAAQVLRYLGMKEADAELLDRVEAAISQTGRWAQFRIQSVRMAIRCSAKGVQAGSQRFQSSFLQRQLQGCEEALVFAATLGADLDRALARESALTMSGAVVFNAAANAWLEEELSAWRQRQNQMLFSEKLTLAPRACPGYGDWAVEDLPGILSLAQARYIGITATQSCMLAPAKSVAGMIGLTGAQLLCKPEQDCSRCAKGDCQFRR